MEAGTRLFALNWWSAVSGAKLQASIRGSVWTNSHALQRLFAKVWPGPSPKGCANGSFRPWISLLPLQPRPSVVRCAVSVPGHRKYLGLSVALGTDDSSSCVQLGPQRDQLSSRCWKLGTGVKKHSIESTHLLRFWHTGLPHSLGHQCLVLVPPHAAPSLCSRAMHGSAPRTSGAPQSGGRRSVVAVGMSGGVDSAVSALLLQRAGYDVVGLFMRNWDAQEEDEAGQCSADQDLKDARMACKHLGIPLQEVDFVRRYWTDVFEAFVAECAQGLTPNPDLPCNRHIKFDALLHHALDQGADMLATGHYARLDAGGEGGVARLLRGHDISKDQSYFLAQVPGSALSRVLFPVGGYLKPAVRQLAADAGLLNAQKRSSRGICFVGKRRFEDFIAQYVPLRTGPFVNVEDGKMVGTHRGLAAYTNGQRARIGGSPVPWFVVGKATDENAVLVALGEDHPALFTSTALVAPLFWVAGQPPQELIDGQEMGCSFKARYVQLTGKCTVQLVEGQGDTKPFSGVASLGKFERSAFSRVVVPELSQRAGAQTLVVRFETPERALTPRQALVLYDGDVCLGGGLLAHPGRTIYELHNSDFNVISTQVQAAT